MRMAAADRRTDRADSCELLGAAYLPVHKAGSEDPEACPRIALLTPYAGGNLGDAAIQDAMIANLRLCLPDAQFSGVSLNCDSFAERHGAGGFPLCGTNRPFYGMSHGSVTGEAAIPAGTPGGESPGTRLSLARRALERTPWLRQGLRKMRSWASIIPREVRHSIQGYRFLRTQDVLIVSGGGQLDEEWGGPWGHPFALFKWAVLARMARVPCAVASVGACKVTSSVSRLFLSAALGMACYRSYRDEKSRRIATGLLERAARDSVVPDLAFSIPASELPPPGAIRSMSQGRTVVALSPIAYAKSESWPRQDHALYDRYVRQMAQVVSRLLARGYFLVIVCSSLGDDDRVIPEILDHLDDDAKKKVPGQMHVPAIATWKDLVASLQDADVLIASRLHSVILGFVASRPAIAISFDPKVDWVMQDLGQTDYLLHIRDFSAGDVLDALDRVQFGKTVAAKDIASYQHRILPVCKLQYDALAELALASHRLRN